MPSAVLMSRPPVSKHTPLPTMATRGCLGLPHSASISRGARSAGAAPPERAPRLIEVEWGNPKHPRVAIVGKGVCFDSGGLDLKPASGMVLGLNLARNLRFLVADVKTGDARNAALASDEVLPAGLDVAAKRRDEAQTGDDNSAHSNPPK